MLESNLQNQQRLPLVVGGKCCEGHDVVNTCAAATAFLVVQNDIVARASLASSVDLAHELVAAKERWLRSSKVRSLGSLLLLCYNHTALGAMFSGRASYDKPNLQDMQTFFWMPLVQHIFYLVCMHLLHMICKWAPAAPHAAWFWFPRASSAYTESS